MVKNKDSIQYIFTVAFAVCLVCAIIVSTAAVSLRPLQVKNKELDFKKNILAAAGLLVEGKSVEEQFAQVETRLVDLKAGTFSDAYDIEAFDPVQATKDPAFSSSLDASIDIASIKRLESHTEVYLIKDASGQLEKVILPVRGYALWSTLWGFIALEKDLNTIAGLGFYSHAETPGLGGEIDNPKWLAQWPGKKLLDSSGNLALTVTKGGMADMTGDHEIDGLAGATLTTNGVDYLVQFWLGENGFRPFIENLKSGGA